MTPEELAELRKHAERDDFTDGYQADGRGELKPAKTPYYMILLPSNFRAALAAAQQEARAAALEERDREWAKAVMAADACAADDCAYGLHVGKHIEGVDSYRDCGCAPLRALLEGK